MKSAVWYGRADVRIEDVPEPRVNSDEILVKVKTVGICGSDAHAFEGKSKRRVPPLVLGHEFAGVVADVGAEVHDFQNGDRIVVEPVISCGRCESCKEGRRNSCPDMRLIGLHTHGAFAEYVAVPADTCYELPENVSFDEAAFVEPLAVATHAINMTPTKIGDELLVVGSGVIGLLVLQVARHRVGGNVFVSDLIEFKLDLAKRLGANAIINPRREDATKIVRQLTSGRGVDAVIEAVGVQDTLEYALAVVKKGGHVTIIGLLEQMMQFDVMKLVTNEITMRGDYLYTDEDFKTSLDLITNRIVNVKPLITHTFTLTEIAKAVDLLTAGKEEQIKILLRP